MKRIKSTYLEKNPRFLSVRKDTLELDNGTVIDGYIVNESSDWVNAVVLTEQNELVLVEQYRHAVEKNILEIPAGSPEKGESPEEAIMREVQEETGYSSVRPPIYLGKYYVNPGSFTNSIHTYLFKECKKTSEQNLDDTEEIDVLTIPWDEVDHWIDSGKLTQLFSVQAILLAQKYLKKGANK
jgi:8-oxo-dGTP pyrophosphatase MutT (NUDIX family)